MTAQGSKSSTTGVAVLDNTSTKEPRISTPQKSTFSALLLTVSLFIQLACCLILWLYDATHGDDSHKRTKINIPGFSIDILIPSAVVDPSALLFLYAVMIYGLSVSIFYSNRKADRYQDWFLMLGTSCGVLAGSLSAIQETNLDALKAFVPVSITLALVFSLVVHAILARLE